MVYTYMTSWAVPSGVLQEAGLDSENIVKVVEGLKDFYKVQP